MRKLLADSTEYGVSGDDPRGDRNTKGSWDIHGTFLDTPNFCT